MHGVEAVEQQQNERIQHLQSRRFRGIHFRLLQTQVEQLQRTQNNFCAQTAPAHNVETNKIKKTKGMSTLRPASTRMCMLVRLLTRAFCPPLFGVGGRRRQLGGGSLGSGGASADSFSLQTPTRSWSSCRATWEEGNLLASIFQTL